MKADLMNLRGLSRYSANRLDVYGLESRVRTELSFVMLSEAGAEGVPR